MTGEQLDCAPVRLVYQEKTALRMLASLRNDSRMDSILILAVLLHT